VHRPRRVGIAGHAGRRLRAHREVLDRERNVLPRRDDLRQLRLDAVAVDALVVGQDDDADRARLRAEAVASREPLARRALRGGRALPLLARRARPLLIGQVLPRGSGPVGARLAGEPLPRLLGLALALLAVLVLTLLPSLLLTLLPSLRQDLLRRRPPVGLRARALLSLEARVGDAQHQGRHEERPRHAPRDGAQPPLVPTSRRRRLARGPRSAPGFSLDEEQRGQVRRVRGDAVGAELPVGDHHDEKEHGGRSPRAHEPAQRDRRPPAGDHPAGQQRQEPGESRERHGPADAGDAAPGGPLQLFTGAGRAATREAAAEVLGQQEDGEDHRGGEQGRDPPVRRRGDRRLRRRAALSPPLGLLRAGLCHVAPPRCW